MTTANFAGLAREALIGDAEAAFKVGGIAREALIAQTGLDPAAGTITKAGKAVTTNAKVAPGNSGHTVTGKPVLHTVTLAASVGAFHLTGQSLAVAGKLIPGVGAFHLTGQAATDADKLAAAAGAFALAGQATLELDKLAASAGAFALTGQDAVLSHVEGNSGGLAALVQAAKGLGGGYPTRRRLQAILGRGWARLPGFWIAADGAASDPPEGEGRALLDIAILIYAAGGHGVAGDGLPILFRGMTATGAGFVAPFGAGFAEIAPSLRGAGRHDHFNPDELALLPLLLEL